MTIVHDLRHAVRTLRRARGFSAAAVLTLGIGIALCTTTFVVMRVYLLKNLPYPDAERLYSVRYGPPGSEPRSMESLDWASLSDVIEYPVAWDLDVFYLLGGENAEAVPGAWVTPGFLQGLGVRPAIGRGLESDAFASGGPNAVLISHRLWNARFGGDPAAVGRTFPAYVSDRSEEAETFTIAGVLPADFWHINPYTDVIAPLRAPTYPYMVRLRTNAAPLGAAARIEALVRAGTPVIPEGFAVELIPSHRAYVETVRPVLNAIGAAAVLVLLVACANVAGLMLVRAIKRRQELAIRTALGADRWAILRMVTAEAVIVALGAAALALYVTDIALGALGPYLEQQIGRRAPSGTAAFALDAQALAIAALLGFVAAAICGAASLPGVLRPGLLGDPRQRATRTTTDGRQSGRIRTGLIALEIAASFALLAGSTLMIRSVVTLLRADLGFEAGQVLQASVTLRQSTYPDAPSRQEAFRRLLSRIEEIPGVSAVGLTTAWPVQQPRSHPVSASDGPAVPVPVHGVTTAYFATMSTPILRGRPFGEADMYGSAPAAIVSASLARRLWPGQEDPTGARLRVTEQGRGEPVTTERTVVGVAADVRQGPADEDLADLYVPLLQTPGRFAFVMVRTAGAPADWTASLRLAFRDVDPEMAVNAIVPLRSTVDALLVRPRFLTALLTAFALASALAALVGIYGVIAYAVRQREREIAVRIAIGAEPSRLTRMFIGEGAGMLGAGLLLGALGALAAGRLVESQLVGVTPRDPVALGGTAVLFAAAGLLAIWWPSRRAARTDPAVALRSE